MYDTCFLGFLASIAKQAFSFSKVLFSFNRYFPLSSNAHRITVSWLTSAWEPLTLLMKDNFSKLAQLTSDMLWVWLWIEWGNATSQNEQSPFLVFPKFMEFQLSPISLMGDFPIAPSQVGLVPFIEVNLNVFIVGAFCLRPFPRDMGLLHHNRVYGFHLRGDRRSWPTNNIHSSRCRGLILLLFLGQKLWHLKLWRSHGLPSCQFFNKNT